MRRSAIWIIVLSAVTAVGRAAWRPSLNWTERRWGIKAPEFPLTAMEREFLSWWRRTDFEPPKRMSSTPFHVWTETTDGTPSLEAITVENTSDHVIRDVWFFRQGAPNFHDARTLVESVTSGLKTETEKAVALWGLFPTYYYNWYPVQEGGTVLDPVTQLAVLGTAQCNYAVSVLETLCQMAGMETHPVGISYARGGNSIEHCVMEVRADGRWIYLDPDGHAAYRMPDGRWAGVEDLRRDPSIVRAMPHAYYNNAFLEEAFAKGEVSVLDTSGRDPFSLARRQTDVDRFSPYHHVMRFDLPPGARVALYPNLRGRSYGLTLPLFANGLLTWTFRPDLFAKGSCRGVLLENAVAEVRDGALVLRREKPGREASLVVPMASPYLIVGARFVGEIEAEEEVQVFALPFDRIVSVAESGWQLLAAFRGYASASHDDPFQRRPFFGYAVKVRVPGSGAIIRSLVLSAWLQCAPKALPRLDAGDNVFVLFSEGPSVSSPLPEGEIGARFDNGLAIRFKPSRLPVQAAMGRPPETATP